MRIKGYIVLTPTGHAAESSIVDAIKTEAIKEFADKLKNKIQKSIDLYMNNCSNGYFLAEDVPLEIDCLVEEMTR